MTDIAASEQTCAEPKRSGSRGFYDKEVQGVIWQVVTIGVVIGFGWFLYSNMLHNLETGFRSRPVGTFLERASSFDIGESMIEYSSASPYWKALLVGLINTFRIAIIGCILATILGVFVGVASLSRNFLVNKLTAGYIHILRNIPVLLQMIFWIAAHPCTCRRCAKQSRSSVIGDHSARLVHAGAGSRLWLDDGADRRSHRYSGNLDAVALGARALGSRPERRSRCSGSLSRSCSSLPTLGWAVGGAPTDWNSLQLGRFNIRGGINLSPEFLAVLIALTLYTAAFIGEIVRSGILSVPKGQVEAARALGLRESVIMRKIILPQALRVIVPPQTSQYLNLTKNSSLSVAIGYPDFVNTANTTINQTGQAVEVILIVMVIYLTISLSISLFMNWYNRQIQLVER